MRGRDALVARFDQNVGGYMASLAGSGEHGYR